MFYRNKYKSNVNAFEALAKDVSRWVWVLARAIRTGRRPGALLCYPDFPGSRTIVRKVARKLGLEVHNRPERFHALALAYRDATKTMEDELAPLPETALNYRCRDISKDTVDATCEEIFGYATRIDPRTYVGRAVEKSLENAVHDGRVVDCPVENPREDAIYQVVIDNSAGNGEVVDLRVPVTGGEIPLVYLKYKTLAKRFTNDTHRAVMARVEDHLSREEVQQIVAFARAFGLDCGELDVLRDKVSGRIYIVDVNKTPYGPPAGLPRQEAAEAVRLLAAAFERQFLNAQQG